ncbi:MAG: DUF2283 domain-containing protein [Lentisphaeria bacterium]|nr:DUF2283 domain-containing protein [Lentisphaeria bacterium]
MNKSHMTYFEDDDVLHMIVAEGEEARSVEISPNITAELDKDGLLLGIEILEASTFLRDSILESVEAKVLHLTGSAA